MLGMLLIFFLARTLAHPLDPPRDDSTSPTASIVNAIVNAGACIRDPKQVRSLWELLYNCLGTIFICTYVAVHPNMPRRSDSKTKRVLQRLQTNFYALLVPEAIIIWAMRQNLVASKIAKQYQAYGWTKAHGFFVQMGGLVYDGKQCRVITMDGDGTGNVYLSTERQAWMKNIRMPILSEEEILDKGKGNFLSKALAILQTSSFVLQCCARHSQGLVITELELVTLAFATLNVFTYFLWWNKPLNAEFPIYFKPNGDRSSGPLQVSRGASWKAESYRGLWAGWVWVQIWEMLWGGARESAWDKVQRIVKDYLSMVKIWTTMIRGPFISFFLPLIMMIEVDKEKRTTVNPYHAGATRNEYNGAMMYASVFIGLVFGGMHLLGWNLNFLTDTERTLWRYSSVIMTVFPALFAVFLALRDLDGDHEDSRLHIPYVCTAVLSLIVGPVIYTLARITLLILPLFALRDLPPSAYQNVQWVVYIPHI